MQKQPQVDHGCTACLNRQTGDNLIVLIITALSVPDKSVETFPISMQRKENFSSDLNFQQTYLSLAQKEEEQGPGKMRKAFLPSKRFSLEGYFMMDAKNRLGKVPKGIKISQVYFYI